MFEPKPVQVGPFLLPLTWLVLFILIWIGGKIADHFFGKKESTFYWSEVLFEATLLFLIFLKLSPILWNPQVLIDRPITLLYGFGSSGGGVLAMLLSGVYIGWKGRKTGTSWPLLLDGIALTALIVGIGYSFLFQQLGEITSLPWGIGIEGGQYDYHPINFYRGLWLTLIFILWWRFVREGEQGRTFSLVMIGGGLGMLFISYLEYYPISSSWGLQINQWVFVMLMVIGWALRAFQTKLGGNKGAL